MFRFIINLWLTVWLSFLTAVVVQSQRRADIWKLQGVDTEPGKTAPPDLQDRMEQAVWHRAEPLVISEADANHYLASVIQGRLIGATHFMASFKRVAVQFEPGLCRVWFEWGVGGHRNTASLDVTIKRVGPNFITEVVGGSYGRLPVRRGALAALVPGCRTLCEALEDEIHGIYQMNQIRFEKNKMVLDPRFETKS